MGITDWFKSKPKVDPVHVTDASYKEVIANSELPVLLDVWGPGCAPCVKLMPTIQALATKYDGAVRVAELNAAEAQATAAKLKVRGTPTLLLIKKGHVVERIVGFRPQVFIEQAMTVKFPEVFES
jgi:thioredoxin 1